LGTIPAQGSVTVTVTSTATTPAAACQSQPNPAAIATADGNLRAEDGGSLSCTPLPPTPQLAVVKTPDGGTFAQGAQVSYQIVVRNPAAAGAQPATNVNLTDALPGNGGLVWATATTTQGTCTSPIVGNSLSCALGTIPAQGSVTVTVTSTATTPAAACQSQPNPAAIATADGGLRAEDGGSLSCTPAVCNVTVDKTCQVLAPTSDVGTGTCQKPINVLTLEYAGAKSVKTIQWYKGAVGSTLLGTLDRTANPIVAGEVLSFAGFGGSPNDVEMRLTYTDNNMATSQFHISCSDTDMNGPEDCGKLEGNGKNNASTLANVWLFRGTNGSNGGISCPIPTDSTFPALQSCSFTEKEVSCATLGVKPKSLTFRYTGEPCSASNNPQGGKATCTATPAGSTLNGSVTVVAAGGSDLKKDLYTVTGSPVAVNGTFTIAFGGSDLKADSYIQVTDGGGDKQLNKIHTSCSQTLAVGDQFGGLELVAINGEQAGRIVEYGYKVTNAGAAVSGTVTDDKLGPVGTFSLEFVGDSKTFTLQALIDQTTTNTATVNATLSGTTTSCSASDSLTVEVTPPPAPPAACSELKPIDGIKLEFDPTLSSVTVGKTITSVQWYRTTVSNLNSPNAADLVGSTGAIANGQVFDFTGFAAKSATNDVDFVVTLSDGSKIRSRFHRSCSDNDMNDIADCGKPQGDGKNNDAGPNIWRLRDLSGNGKVLGCPVN
jgi:uncharacterized repeat protein (TIGR01451 family)